MVDNIARLGLKTIGNIDREAGYYRRTPCSNDQIYAFACLEWIAIISYVYLEVELISVSVSTKVHQ